MILKFLPVILGTIFILNGCAEEEKIPEGMHKVEVVETMNASNYTYMKVDENGDEYWIAVTQRPAEIGDIFYYSKSMEMKNFTSGKLNRTFDRILFVEDISNTPAPASSAPGMGGMNPHSQVMSGKKEVKVDPFPGGETVGMIYNNKKEYDGKEITIRGIVTKYNPGILDRNWIHIQDGTGSGENFDLIVTSTDETEEGKTIIIKGVVTLNKDFGNGYSYDVLVENASVKTE